MVFLLHVIREMSKSLRIFDSRFMNLLVLVLTSLKVRLPSWDTMGPGVPWTVFSLENWSCWRGQAWFEQRSFLDKLKKGDYFIRLIGGFGVVVHDTFWWGSLFNHAKIGNDWKCKDTTWSTCAQQWSYLQGKVNDQTYQPTWPVHCPSRREWEGRSWKSRNRKSIQGR